MDRRTALAFLLIALVIVGVPMLFGPSRTYYPDTTQTASPPAPSVPAANPTGPAAAATAPPGAAAVPGSPGPTAVPAAVAGGRGLDSLTLDAGRTRHVYALPHAVPMRVALSDYRDLSPRRGAIVAIENAPPAGRVAPIIQLRLVLNGRDTVALSSLAMTGEVVNGVARFQSATPPVTIEYRPTGEGYLTQVRGSAPGATALLIDLPAALRSFEADTTSDFQQNAYGYLRGLDEIESISLGKLDSTQFRTDLGPMSWVAARNKYFLLALVAPDTAARFESLRMRGGSPIGEDLPTAHATATLPVKQGAFGFDMYAGPQSWERLKTVSTELENVNPYAGFMHSVAQPFVTIVMRMLLWMKSTLQVNYGWVLIIFGVVVRLLMWPLNQSAMRSSIRMGRLQPEMQALQKRYADDREAQQRAIMELYRKHGMSPLSPLIGCLPMMLPMPILFALYFVFQNTIEFRGVPFLWMPDIALADPYYITPIFMGVSMFVLSWIGLRGAPPNPQAKVLAYMMPPFMTYLFLNFPAGLNLYYGVQNVVALPQQWLLTRERVRSTAG
jgi:YidC/Oxa1 family membrane protein insertase